MLEQVLEHGGSARAALMQSIYPSFHSCLPVITPPRPQQISSSKHGSHSPSKHQKQAKSSTVDLTGDTDSEPSQSQEIQRPIIEKRSFRPSLPSTSNSAINSPRNNNHGAFRSTIGSSSTSRIRDQGAGPTSSGPRVSSASDPRMVSGRKMNVCSLSYLFALRSVVSGCLPLLSLDFTLPSIPADGGRGIKKEDRRVLFEAIGSQSDSDLDLGRRIGRRPRSDQGSDVSTVS